MTLAARKAITSGVNFRAMARTGEISMSLFQKVKQFPPYYKLYPESSTKTTRRKSSITRPDFEVESINIYLSSTTLVIVPDNLIDQWQHEINKHFESIDALDVLVLDRLYKTIPPPQQLIQYDLVLITDHRFSGEEKRSTTEFKGVPRGCKCPYFGSTRTVRCVCPVGNPKESYFSPLLSVHWKRVIVDEGHSMSHDRTNRMILADKLIAERRWICTGTPTKNLTHATEDWTTGTTEQPNALVDNHAGGYDPKAEADDFYRLGKLIGSFLKLPPFSKSSNAWATYISTPFKRGTDPISKRLLTQLLNSLFIRNQQVDIEKCVKLPDLTERIVSLPPTYFQAMTYNVYVSFFHLNSITSERTHQDYFLHESNRKHFNLLFTNLRLSCSWLPNWSDELGPSLQRAKDTLSDYEIGKRNFSDEDIALLKQCIEVMSRAVEDPVWSYLMNSQDLGYWVDSVPSDCHSWVYKDTATEALDDSNELDCRMVMLPEAIKSFQDHVRERVTGVISEDRTRDGNKPLDLLNGSNKGKKTSKAISIPQHPPTPITTTTTTINNETPRINNDKLEEYKQAKILGTMSSKFGYLITQILKYYQTEKCIVFTQEQNDMYFLYHALKIHRVPALFYSTYESTNALQRAQIIMTFNTSLTYNVILMDTKLAAFGINLPTASRIWFFSPVWEVYIKRQAIKRAHRIGQKRDVVVETLVTKGSIEEAILSRRREIDQEEHEAHVAKKVEDDGKMRRMILQAEFIPITTTITTTTKTTSPDVNRSKQKLEQKPVSLWNFVNIIEKPALPRNITIITKKDLDKIATIEPNVYRLLIPIYKSQILPPVVPLQMIQLILLWHLQILLLLL